MERFAQYLDDLEDICYSVALLFEKIRRLLRLSLLFSAFALFLYGSIKIALSHPPLALAIVCLLITSLLYFGATGRFEPPGNGVHQA